MSVMFEDLLHVSPEEPGDLERRRQLVLHCFARVRAAIQPDISSSAAGATVSGIAEYSISEPVFAVWNMWFRPSSSFTVASRLPPALSAAAMPARFSFGGTWKSLLPLIASTGHRTLASSARGSYEKKNLIHGVKS